MQRQQNLELMKIYQMSMIMYFLTKTIQKIQIAKLTMILGIKNVKITS